MNKDKLIEWALSNLEFYNCPENWEDTYIIDILNGYDGVCHDVDGKVYSYAKIRAMFDEEDTTDHEEKTNYLEEKLQVCGYNKDDLYELEYLKRGVKNV